MTHSIQDVRWLVERDVFPLEHSKLELEELASAMGTHPVIDPVLPKYLFLGVLGVFRLVVHVVEETSDIDALDFKANLCIVIGESHGLELQ